jgi:hypothetical protein
MSTEGKRWRLPGLLAALQPFGSGLAPSRLLGQLGHPAS